MLRTFSEFLAADSESQGAAWGRFKEVCARRAPLKLPASYAKLPFADLKESQAKKLVNGIVGKTTPSYVCEVKCVISCVAGALTEAEIQEIQMDSSNSAIARATIAGAPLSPVVQLPPATRSRPRWSRHEDIRLMCCLLDSTDPILQGSCFLEQFKGAPTRAELNMDRSPFEVRLALMFNNASKRWPELETFAPVVRYDPCLMDALSLPRSKEDIVKRFKGELTSQHP